MLSRWLSADPAMEKYLPSGGQIFFPEKPFNPSNDLPGQGGVYYSVNLNTYHYASLNPIKFIDPDGEHALLLVVPIAIYLVKKYHESRARAGDPSAKEMVKAGETFEKALEYLPGPGKIKKVGKIVGIIKGAKDKGKKAGELISGKLKRSKSFFRELSTQTPGELQNLAKGKDKKVATKAKKMLKLIKSSTRIKQKIKQKPR